MKIQCVMNLINRRHGYDEEAELQFSDFSAPESFDDYDLNVISLQSNEIWRNSSGITETESVDYSEDFTSLKKIINKTKKSKILLLYPRNSKFKTRYSGGNSYRVEYPLKDILGSLDFILKQLLDKYSEKIYFECNNVSLQNYKLKADFCFENSNNSFLDSRSGKCVGKCLNETVFLSTVVIEEYSQNIFKKLYDLAFPSEKVSAPDWFLEEKFLMMTDF